MQGTLQIFDSLIPSFRWLNSLRTPPIWGFCISVFRLKLLSSLPSVEHLRLRLQARQPTHHSQAGPGTSLPQVVACSHALTGHTPRLAPARSASFWLGGGPSLDVMAWWAALCAKHSVIQFEPRLARRIAIGQVVHVYIRRSSRAQRLQCPKIPSSRLQCHRGSLLLPCNCQA